MLTKSRVIERIQSMPDELTLNARINHLRSLDNLKTALNNIRMGKVHQHEDVVAEARQWIRDKQPTRKTEKRTTL